MGGLFRCTIELSSEELAFIESLISSTGKGSARKTLRARILLKSHQKMGNF